MHEIAFQSIRNQKFYEIICPWNLHSDSMTCEGSYINEKELV